MANGVVLQQQQVKHGPVVVVVGVVAVVMADDFVLQHPLLIQGPVVVVVDVVDVILANVTVFYYSNHW